MPVQVTGLGIDVKGYENNQGEKLTLVVGMVLKHNMPKNSTINNCL